MKKVILITGASSGLGLASARALAAQGHTVYGTSRHPDSVKEASFMMVQMDVTDDASVHAAVEKVLKTEGRIDVLINNAGITVAGPLYAMPVSYAQKQLDVNFLGVVRVNSTVLPGMINQGYGLVIHIGSIAGLLGVPYQGLYSASKFALEGYAESLRMELQNTGIRVIMVNPGDFKTTITANREKVPFTLNHPKLKTEFDAALTQMETDEMNGADPGLLAKQICKIVSRPKPAQRYLVGAIGQTIVPALKKVLPAALFAKLLNAHYGIK